MSCIAISNPNLENHSTNDLQATIEPSLKHKVLVVDDSVINQKIISKMLLMLGYDVDVASDGKQVLNMYQNGYDAIILDYELPDMSGKEICKIIRKNEMEGITSVPVIIATTHQDEDTKNECLLAGANRFINKPIPIELLSEILKNIIVQNI